MAYQNVGRPRFYCNVIEWLTSNGAIDLSGYNEQLYRTVPVNPIAIPYDTSTGLSIQGMTENSFIAILGHNLGTSGYYHVIYDSTGSSEIPYYNVVNVIDGGYSNVKADYDGFSIATFNNGNDPISGFTFSSGAAVAGSVIIGTYYDMPHSPELSLTMSRDMDGVKRVRTRGGTDLIDHKYTKSQNWGATLAPWELSSPDVTPLPQKLSRVGRRSWDLSFNYLSDSDLFPDSSSLSNFGVSGWGGVGGTETDNTLLDEDTFYSQVIHKTNGGQLPFIFQPDSSNNNPDQFAIAKLDSDFEVNQVANGVYNMKVVVREIW